MIKEKKSKIENELKLEFSKKFISEEKFAEQIESYYSANGYDNYILAIADYCEQNKIDIDSVAKLISKQFKKKIEVQAIKLHYLNSKPSPELPI